MSDEQKAPVPDDLAVRIVKRIVGNTVGAQWTRNIEPLQDEDSEFPTEEELLSDALALALGDDIGCLDEQDEDFSEKIDVLWVRKHIVALEQSLRESKKTYEVNLQTQKANDEQLIDFEKGRADKAEAENQTLRELVISLRTSIGEIRGGWIPRGQLLEFDDAYGHLCRRADELLKEKP